MNRGFPFDQDDEDEGFWKSFEDMIEGDNDDFVTEEDTKDGKVRKYGPFVYGFSYTKKPGEDPEVREFGNVKPSGRGKIRPAQSGEREPLTEVVDLGEKYEVTVEMPGVKKDDIELSATEERLKVETSGDRKFKKSVSFEERIDPEAVEANFKNGILTVELEKRDTGEDEGHMIEIE